MLNGFIQEIYLRLVHSADTWRTRIVSFVFAAAAAATVLTLTVMQLGFLFFLWFRFNLMLYVGQHCMV